MVVQRKGTDMENCHGNCDRCAKSLLTFTSKSKTKAAVGGGGQ